MDHIKPLRLFELSQAETMGRGAPLNEEEKQHLRECDECQQVLQVFARQFTSQRLPHNKPKDAA
jgi:hypothetical protein